MHMCFPVLHVGCSSFVLPAWRRQEPVELCFLRHGEPGRARASSPQVSASSDASWSHYLKPIAPGGANPLTNHTWKLYAALALGMMRNRTLVGTKPGQLGWNEQDAPVRRSPSTRGPSRIICDS